MPTAPLRSSAGASIAPYRAASSIPVILDLRSTQADGASPKPSLLPRTAAETADLRLQVAHRLRASARRVPEHFFQLHALPVTRSSRRPRRSETPARSFAPLGAFMTISFPTPAFCSRSYIRRDLQCGRTTSRILALGTDAPAGPASPLPRQASAPPAPVRFTGLDAATRRRISALRESPMGGDPRPHRLARKWEERR